MVETSSLPDEGWTWNHSSREVSWSPSRPRMRIEYRPGVGVFTWYGLVPGDIQVEVGGGRKRRGCVEVKVE